MTTHPPGFRHPLRNNALRVLLTVLAVLFGPQSLQAQNSPPPGTPSVMEVCAVFCGRWTWDNGQYYGLWTNGAVAIMTVKSFTTTSILIDRTDTPQSVSYGLTAVYTGKILSDGNSATGSVTWTWPGVAGYPATDTWTATWAANTCAPAPTFAPPPVDILDPVPDLLDGAVITTDTAVLGSQGRQVKGASADGIAQIVLRVGVQSSGDKITAVLDNDHNKQSSSSDKDGGFVSLGEAVEPGDQLPSAASATADSEGYAFLVYRAPIDFVRSSSNQDTLEASRSVSVHINYATQCSQQYATQTITLEIVRPPVVLIHGYAADYTTWDDFMTLFADPVFSIIPVNYGEYEPVAYTSPELPLPTTPHAAGISEVRESDLGFTESTGFVAGQIEQYIDQFKNGNNPLRTQVAAIKADLVAHSMGGLIARYWTTGKAEEEYITPETFDSGYIHSLITLGTPHFGTPLARLDLEDNSICTRRVGYFANRLAFDEAVFPDGDRSPGAVYELEGDGVGDYLSDPIDVIESSSLPVPTAQLAGLVQDQEFSGATVIHIVCDLLHFVDPSDYPKDPLARLFTPELFDYIFDPILTPNNPYAGDGPRANDGAVPLTSALSDSDADYCNLPDCFGGVAHGNGTAALVGASENLLDTSAVSMRVKDILNTPLNDTSTWSSQ
jgi:pimeloyl-ACP methyl ester carboxylesterase